MLVAQVHAIGSADQYTGFFFPNNGAVVCGANATWFTRDRLETHCVHTTMEVLGEIPGFTDCKGQARDKRPTRNLTCPAGNTVTTIRAAKITILTNGAGVTDSL